MRDVYCASLFASLFFSYVATMGSTMAAPLPAEETDIDDKNYLVVLKGNANSSITLIPHEAAQGIQADIAGQSNSDMVKETEDKLHTLAILDWPKNAEGGMMTIVTRFDNDKLDTPACSQSVNLLKDDRYFYPQWKSMKVKSLANGGDLIGIHAAGSDSDGEGSGGWDMVAFLKLTPACSLSVLYRQDNEWAENADDTGCRGEHLDFRFLDGRTAEIMMTAHTCGTKAISKAKVIRKKIRLN